MEQPPEAPLLPEVLAPEWSRPEWVASAQLPGGRRPGWDAGHPPMADGIHRRRAGAASRTEGQAFPDLLETECYPPALPGRSKPVPARVRMQARRVLSQLRHSMHPRHSNALDGCGAAASLRESSPRNAHGGHLFP